jgi:hypothetical protein
MDVWRRHLSLAIRTVDLSSRAWNGSDIFCTLRRSFRRSFRRPVRAARC